MTKTEITAVLTSLDLSPNVWLHENNPWDKVSTICTQSTYHVYLNPDYDYRFNHTKELLEVAIMDNSRTIKKVITYDNIKCFNGTYIYSHGVPVQKNFR